LLEGSGQKPLAHLAPPPERPLADLTEPPTFSVVIAAYQAAETVGRAILSALQQATPAKEVIVVDDGSTDETPAVIREFGDQIVTIRQDNRGLSAARNRALETASGDFVAMLDADDTYHPRRLEALTELAVARPDLDLITTDARMLVGDREVGRFAAFTPFVVEDQRTAIFTSCFVGGWPAVRLERLRAIGGFDTALAIGLDWDCWLRLILAGAAAGMVDAPYYDYTLHSGSLSASRVPSLWERARLTEKALMNPALKPDERPTLLAAVRMHRSRAVEAEAERVLYHHGERGPLPRLAVARRLRLRVRLVALLSAALPPLGRRLVQPYQTAENRFPGEP